MAFTSFLLGHGLLAVCVPVSARAQAPPTPGHAPVRPLHFPFLPETAPRPAPFDTVQVDRWLAVDKAKHVGASFLLVLSSQYALTSKIGLSETEALPLSIGVSVSVGLAKELYDWKFSPTHTFSLRDLAADLFGIVLAVGFIWL